MHTSTLILQQANPTRGQREAFDGSVFYLPSHWKAAVKSDFSNILKDLHFPGSSDAANISTSLDAANTQLRTFSGAQTFF